MVYRHVLVLQTCLPLTHLQVVAVGTAAVNKKNTAYLTRSPGLGWSVHAAAVDAVRKGCSSPPDVHNASLDRQRSNSAYHSLSKTSRCRSPTVDLPSLVISHAPSRSRSTKPPSSRRHRTTCRAREQEATKLHGSRVSARDTFLCHRLVNADIPRRERPVWGDPSDASLQTFVLMSTMRRLHLTA